jgi:ribonuclease D
MARRRDIAPGRVLPDSAITAAALAMPTTEDELLGVSIFNGRSLRRSVTTWFAAVAAAMRLPEDDLPDLKARYDGPPPARSWPERDPAAAARLAAGRAAVAEIAAEYELPTENLLAPDSIRRLAWSPPPEITPAVVGDVLHGLGARDWQVDLTAAALAAALASPAVAVPAAETDDDQTELAAGPDDLVR